MCLCVYPYLVVFTQSIECQYFVQKYNTPTDNAHTSIPVAVNHNVLVGLVTNSIGCGVVDVVVVFSWKQRSKVIPYVLLKEFKGYYIQQLICKIVQVSNIKAFKGYSIYMFWLKHVIFLKSFKVNLHTISIAIVRYF